MESLLINLIRTNCGKGYASEEKLITDPVGCKVLIRLCDLAKARIVILNTEIRNRPRSYRMWRCFGLLSVSDKRNFVILGEGETPFLSVRNQGEPFGANQLFIKQVRINPTGSLNACDLVPALSKAKEQEVKNITMPSTGKAWADSSYKERELGRTFSFLSQTIRRN